MGGGWTGAPWGALFTHELSGHTARVHAVEFSYDGRKLASGGGGNDCSVRVWDAMQSKEGRRLETVLSGHTRAVDTLAWHPASNEVLASATADRSVRLWDTRQCSATGTVQTPGSNLCVAWHPTGSVLCVGSTCDELSFIDPRSHRIVRTLKSSYQVNEFAWSHDGKLFILTTDSGAELLHYPSLRHATSLRGHTAPCYCLALDSNGRRIAIGSADAMVSLWDLDEMMCLHTYGGMASQIRSLSFSADGAHLAVGAEDEHVDIVAVASSTRVHAIAAGAPINSVAFSPTAALLAFAVDGDTTRLKVFGQRAQQVVPPKMNNALQSQQASSRAMPYCEADRGLAPYRQSQPRYGAIGAMWGHTTLPSAPRY